MYSKKIINLKKYFFIGKHNSELFCSSNTSLFGDKNLFYKLEECFENVYIHINMISKYLSLQEYKH